MALPRVAAFTDTYLPTVNGVTYTVKTWREQWAQRDARMDVVYPRSDHRATAGEHPVTSLPFPFYDGFRVGVPRIPSAISTVDIVHAHTPFSLGLAAKRFARKRDAPLVASYHTPTSEYASYLSVNGSIEDLIGDTATRYERWFLDHVDMVITPSEQTATHLESAVGVETPVEVLPNGVDTDFFAPTETAAFRERYDLPDGPLVGYTGRHGYEKNLDNIIRAADGLDVTLVFGGDGPARDDLARLAEEADVDVRFLGFVDRSELPALYATLDVFAFPSPVETQGLVALEANACGTPVVGVDAGALSNTIDDGERGYTYPPGDIDAFRERIQHTLEEYETLRATCLARRDRISVEHSVDRLADIYAQVSCTGGRTQ
ncbi:glycosyl transferase family 1 [Halobacteriales archaeon QS_4_62_28]|nr:MAG: glycosyl transferase family 1 [Halobacteriales archaeon QS_4_62_28]